MATRAGSTDFAIESPVLVADVGGTNARFALADTRLRAPLLTDSIRRYRVADFAAPDAAIRQYLQETGATPRRAVLAIAGRIDEDAVRSTNSTWRVHARELATALGLDHIQLINDFAAQSLCLPLLQDGDTCVLGAPPAPVIGARARQTFAVVGPGTGLGVGALLLREGRFLPLETEAGHCGYAPETAQEIAVLEVLAGRFGRVSSERLISGSGLSNLHQALAHIDGQAGEALAPEEITRRAQAGDDRLCVRSVEMFCAIFGAVAGDAALALGGWDGVFLAGGMPPVLLPWLQQGGFRRRFEGKGRLSAHMHEVPTVLITHPYAGLLGAAASAVIAAGGSLLHGSTARAVRI